MTRRTPRPAWERARPRRESTECSPCWNAANRGRPRSTGPGRRPDAIPWTRSAVHPWMAILPRLVTATTPAHLPVSEVCASGCCSRRQRWCGPRRASSVAAGWGAARRQLRRPGVARSTKGVVVAAHPLVVARASWALQLGLRGRPLDRPCQWAHERLPRATLSDRLAASGSGRYAALPGDPGNAHVTSTASGTATRTRSLPTLLWHRAR